MHGPHHHLELLHGILGDRGATVVRRRGEEAQGVVAPVVVQPLLDQVAVIQVVVDRQQLDGRHPEVGQVLDRRLGGQPGVAAPQPIGDVRVELGEALDVQLVDDRLVPGGPRRPVVAPGEGRIDHGRQRGIGCTVAVVEGQVGLRVVELVAEQLVGPLHVAADRLGVRVEHHLVGVESVPVEPARTARGCGSHRAGRAARRAGRRARPCPCTPSPGSGAPPGCRRRSRRGRAPRSWRSRRRVRS